MLQLFQASGLLVALCVIVALVRVDAIPARQRDLWRYSLRSLLIAMTFVAFAFGFTTTGIRMGLMTPADVSAFAVLNMAAVFIAFVARRLSRVS